MNIDMIKTNEMLAPGCTNHCDLKQEVSIYLITRGTMLVEWRNNQELLEQGDVLVGAKFRLKNNSDYFSTICGLILRDDSLGDFYKNPVIIKKDQQTDNDELSKLTHMLNCPHSLDDMLMNVMRYLPKVMNSIGRIESILPLSKSPIGRIDSRLIIINRYIREHFNEPLTLQTLADLIQCNPVYLSNTYSKIFRISPIKYLQKIRMSKAKVLLTQTNDPINEIANKLGYLSNSQFADLFKRFYGITPREVRKYQLTNK